MNLNNKISNLGILKSIRDGLVLVIPILIIGSFALVFRSVSIPAYTQWIQSFGSGILLTLLDYIYQATFGILSIYITLSIAKCFIESRKQLAYQETVGSILTSLGCFTILIGFWSDSFDISYLGADGMFSALFSAIAGPSLYFFFEKKIRFKFQLYADGADINFNHSLSAMAPMALTILIFGLLNYTLLLFFQVGNFQELFIKSMNQLFVNRKHNMISGAFFVLLSSLLWFFGIHGSNVLDHVASTQYAQGIAINQAAILAGKPGTEILTKTFLDSFVLIGGSGSTFCLLLAMLFFGKQRSSKTLSKTALFPMLFNINELMLFGLPIILNKAFFIPFLITPLVMYFIAYLAFFTGLVPVTISAVEWTTPVLFSGYLSTTSIRGVFLQLFLLILGTLIYRPFVIKYEKLREKDCKEKFEHLIHTLQTSEEERTPVTLIDLKTTDGIIARSLALDLKSAFSKQKLRMFYQPQFNAKLQTVGAEALLRFHHPLYGMVYPPLLIKLAQEIGMLTDLEKFIIETVCSNYSSLNKGRSRPFKVSVNLSAPTLKDTSIEPFLAEVRKRYSLQEGEICLEITEQVALSLNDDMTSRFERIQNMGYQIAIDDFSMGATSLKYLQNISFDIVKLDGSLVKDLTNPRSREIISSIVHLSHSLGFLVLAEYVETEKQKKKLEEIGCDCYQGYLVGAAVPLEDFTKYV